MTTAKKAARKTAAKRVQPPSRAKGNLTRAEMTPLIMQAIEAHGYQVALGQVSKDTKFDDWRRAEVRNAVQRDGLSKIDRSQYREVMAHFLTLSGKDEEAMALLTKTGTKGYRPKGQDDTYETCDTYVSLIRECLAQHLQKALPEGQSHIHTGWLVAAARQRAGMPSLTMDTMADRLDPHALKGLLSHLRNHIAKREGRATDRRAPRQYPKKEKPEPVIHPASEADGDEPF